MRVAYQSGAMIPTTQAAAARGRTAGLLRSAIAPAFLASGVLHALALSWGFAAGDRAASAGTGSLPLQVRLASPAPAPVAPPIRPAPVAAPQPAAPSRRVAVVSDPEPVVRRLAVQAVVRAESPTVAAATLVEAARREPAPAIASVNPSPVAPAPAEPDTARADYRALLRAAAERLQRYPERARRLGFEGTAVVAIERQPEDAAPRVVLVRSSGIGMLDRAAVELLDRAAREVEPAPAPPGQLRFPVRYALHDGGD